MKAPFTRLILALSLLATGALCANLATTSGLIVLTEGASGIGLLNRTTFDRITTLPPPESFSGIYDVSAPEDGDLLFALDARGGVVGVYTNAGVSPQFREDSVQEVSVLPFSGVSAANGRMIVSGGTGQLSLFSYDDTGSIELITNDIDFGTGQPDVLVAPSGRYAYVSTDFSGTVDGEDFGITTFDLENPESDANTVGLPGAGFSIGVEGPSNFPVEAGVTDEVLVVAHGGGLSILSLENPGKPSLTTTVDLGFPAVNVDTATDGSFAVVVGGDSVARVDLPDGKVTRLSVEGLQGATGVVVVDDTAVIAGDELQFCGRACLKLGTNGSGGSGDDGDSGDGNDTEDDKEDDKKDDKEDDTAEDNENDNDNSDDNNTSTPESEVCVEESYLLNLKIPRSALLHNGSISNVLCPGHGLPCGTRRHVIRFNGSYMTYEEVCKSVKCTQERRVVNGVSMRHARTLCAKNGNCVVPHVMWSDHWLERALVGGLHSGIVRW